MQTQKRPRVAGARHACDARPMQRDCPLCVVALRQVTMGGSRAARRRAPPPIPPEAICARCGLTWAEVDPPRWGEDLNPPEPPPPPDGPLRMALRPTLG